MLTSKDLEGCIHPRQTPRFYLATLFGVPFGLLLFGFLVFIFPITLLFLLLIWISARVAFAYIVGQTVIVSEYNFPRVHKIVEEVKSELDWKKPLYVFVYEKGEFNALMVRLFTRRAIFLNSDVVDKGVTDQEVRWLVARFVGYLRARRRSGPVGALVRFTENFLLFNFWIFPWERAMVFTGDRVALKLIDGNIGAAVSAMQKLMVGRELGYAVNPTGIVRQHEQVKGSFFAFLARISLPFPHTTARFVDLIYFAKKAFPSEFARFMSENPDLPGESLERLKA